MTAERVLAGVPLSLYVAITVALAQGFELGDVLSHEGVSVEQWEHAERVWSLACASDDPALLDAYDRAFEERQRLFARPVAPLDSDLAAWACFVQHWLAAPDPERFFGELGLGMSDGHLLHSAWSARLAQDPSLRERFGELLGAAPGKLPMLEVAPKRLLHPVEGARPVGVGVSGSTSSAMEPAESNTQQDSEAPLIAELPSELSPEQPSPRSHLPRSLG
jgi:hypothetical protein